MTYAERIGTLLVGAVKMIPRSHFGAFLKLEDIKHKIFQAAKRKEETFPDLVVSYISAAFLIPKILLKNLRWDIVLLLFSLASTKSAPKVSIPILKPNKEKSEKAVWDYEGRGYAMYVHIIASKYGWTQKYIDNLDVDIALALVQEIITDEQLDREFLWSMSDKNYIYNYQTKTSKANPLDRPYFMKVEVQAPKKIMIPKSLMPQGLVHYAPQPEDKIPSPTDLRGL
jgi:hypothetical protein